ncbi:MAG: translation initiation factor IF-2 [Bacteroidetes bacterium]|nr:translation initiation factor IF-2 [Bacteroidota bacterium]
MSEEKTIRLSKAIKEFNLSMDHIVDYLSKKGIKIDSNPNGKLPGEAYSLLLKEFASDKTAKEEAAQITALKVKKDVPVVLDAQVKPKIEPKQDEDVREVLIKNKGAAVVSAEEKPKKKEEKQEKKAEVKKEPEVIKAQADKIEMPKVLGTIDLSASDSKTGKKKKPTKKEIEEAEAAEKVAKKKASKKKKEEEEVAEVKQEEVVASTPVAETPVVTEEVTPPPPQEEQKDEITRVQFDKLTGPKIFGKIELPQEQPKKKPVASSSAFGEREKKKRKRTDRKAGGVQIPDENKKKDFQGFQRPGGGPNKARPRPAHNAPPRAEPTEKEIQDQIKATLARLSGGGKSKSSKQRRARRDERMEEKEAQAQQSSEQKVIKVTEFVSANDLSKMMDVPVTQIISTCMSLGMFVSINQRLDAETLTVVAEEFGYKVEFVAADVQESIEIEPDKQEDLKPRAPIVTVMGHVDHGKTSLLDYIRKANVIAGEAGGITQHIGAYEVKLENGKNITFLDTPGHEAFTAMRARGAKVTDVAIIVISADDSVMPQTIEAINHAQAAAVPIVFAFNKVDKPGAAPDRIKEQLSKMNILVEEWGGKYQSQEISAKLGTNIDSLLDKVLLESEILDLKANPNKRANGTVIESMLDKGRGYVMTVLVQNGTMKVGDILLAGKHSGRVKALFNERGNRIREAGPSQPVQVLGMTGAPQAGDLFHVMDDEREARDIANKRLQLQREQGIRTHKHITLDEIGRRLAIGSFKELNVIVKGDVDGSIEALSDSLLKLTTPEVQVNVIHKSVGQISESDVLLASASNAIVIGFQVRPSPSARKLAEQEEIEIRLYSVIYKAIDEVKAAMEGMLAPDFVEKIVCNIEIREVFKIPKAGTIAGCMVLDGKVTRNTQVRVVRDGIVVHSGTLASLKRFKDDVKEVATGYECGLSINGFNDIQVKDIIEGYVQEEVKRTLA